MKRTTLSFRLCVGVVVLGLVFVCTASAQSTATLSGTVTDATGAVVAGAAVKVHSLDTNADREVTTDESGTYFVPSLQPGNYMIQVNAAGFGQYSVPSLTLQVDQRATMNVKMNIASTGTTVEVTGSTPIIDSSTITVGQVIDKETVQNIPLNGRHFLDLTQLTPGAVVPPANGFLTSASRGLGANSYITAGQREDSANFQINGINLNDMTQNQITFQPSINTTSEFKISNSTFSAEYGRSSGSVVNVSTRSGTKQFHGEAFDYLRNNWFDARNYFNRKGTRQSSLKRNNFGGAFSGPLYKDKTFFFLSYEGLRQSQDILLRSNVPTAAQRAQFATSPAGPAYAQIINLVPVGVESTVNGVRVATATGSSPGPVKTDQFSGDLLHNVTSANTLHLYYAWQQDARTEPNLQLNNVTGFGDHRTAHRQIGTINDVHVFSPNVVNEARLGFNRIAIRFSDNFLESASKYGINNGVTDPIGLPQMTVSDLGLNFGGPSGFPQGRNVTTYVLSDTLSYLKSKHAIKMGGEYRRFNGNNFQQTAGTIAFTSTANFIAGLGNAFTGNPQYLTNRIFINSVAGFVDDNWKISPTFTAEIGFRYEWNGTPTEGGERFVTFDPTTRSFVQVDQPYQQNNNFEPRLGFIYDIFGNGKTTVRGGFGIMADQPIISNVAGLAQNPPNSNPVSLTATATGPQLPVGTLYPSAAASSLAPASVNPKFRNAYMESYNLNLQQDLGWGTALQVGYIGSGGRHLRLNRNLNQLVYAPGATTGTRPYPTVSSTSPYRPNAALGNITYNDSVGMSNYNALWLTVRKSLHGGIQFNTTYTYSKSMDLNSQAGNGVQDSTNPAGSYGLSDFDVRHHFVFSGTWTLPFHGNRLKDGWMVALINQIQGGNPMNVVTTSTYSGSTAAGLGQIRPTRLGPYSTGVGNVLPNGNIPFIRGSVCTTPVAGCAFYTQPLGFGNLQRNALTGPGFSDTDVSLQKTTRIAESVNLVLRMDAFDVFNQVNYGNPVLTATTGAASTFGQISQTRGAIGDAGSSRQLQLAGRIIF
ncbi:TonB-dependent receptor [Edaphobacter aggregans]|uniref:TonB-dependent receptor n=1 Tax=Edaphobacter aggregans TaxID=570835 RepID=UPI001FDEE285|nr:carboxypeptidase regulatory-like domain-containing protein [Edaphobacter aggregans]